MNIPLDEVIFFDAITTHPSTGAATDADSTPTFAVYEESTDTDIGIGGNLTKRTSLTGNYRGTFTLSAANGFEVGKWYSIIGSATVNSIAGKAVLKNFRVVAAEATAGVIETNVKNINNVAAATPGAAGGITIAGSNAATTFAGLTTGALACTTITASGAVAFQSTFAVTTSTALAALSATTVTFSGAVAFQSTFAVTTSTSLAALSATTVTFSGATTLTGAVTASNASNNIVGISVAAFAAAGATALRSAIGMSSANLDTQLAAIAAYIDTEVGAIKAKTDQLTFTVALSVDATASVSAASIRSALGMATNDLDTQLDAILAATGGSAGAGSIPYTVTVNDASSNPLDGAEVWVSTDSAGSNVIAGTLSTDAMGQVTFLLDAGSYYLWVSHSGFNRTNPTAITVS